MRRPAFLIPLLLSGAALVPSLPAVSQQAFSKTVTYPLTPDEQRQLTEKENALAARLQTLTITDQADAAVFLHMARITDRLQDYQNQGQVAAMLRGLDIGLQRCDLLARGETPWRTQPGTSLRGYVSRIDGSVQPYVVVLPAGFSASTTRPWRLDVVLHGRGPNEASFLRGAERPNSKPPNQPCLELHPFGRANNGWRWAGETDVFEALEQVRKLYPIDPDRTILRGFSMGGHGAWQIGVHYPGEWAAVSPGAGFTETRKYQKLAPGAVPAYQETTWHIYDAVDYALNLFNTPFIAYGGEIDPQLQASLNMKEAAEAEGLPFNLIIGPKTAHAYQPDSLKEIMRQLATHVREERPKEIRFATWTLKYNRCRWLTIDGLQQHYHRAVVRAASSPDGLLVTTTNVSALTLDPLTAWPLRIDGDLLRIASPKPGLAVHLTRVKGHWRPLSAASPHPPLRTLRTLRKLHNLQGPIDDAFMERFVAVRGTGTPWTPEMATYADRTLREFQDSWRLGFRAELPVKDDTAVSPEDWRDGNLVLFGDPSSNRLLAKILDRLPIRWTREGVVAGQRRFGPDSIPVLIYPNPLNPNHYVVINSGHTFNRKDLLASNAWLFPKLPDWAILRPSSEVGGADALHPEVLAAGLFDEDWQFPPRP